MNIFRKNLNFIRFFTKEIALISQYSAMNKAFKAVIICIISLKKPKTLVRATADRSKLNVP